MNAPYYFYSKEKLLRSINILATFKGDVRARILSAYTSFCTLEEKHFPAEFRSDWKWIMENITKYGPVCDSRGEILKGSVEHTMRRIKNSTGQKIAQKIFDIGWELWTNERYNP